MKKNLLSLPILSIIVVFALIPAFADDPRPLESDGKESKEQPATEENQEQNERKPAENLMAILSGESGVRVAQMCTNCNVANVTMCGQTGDRVQVWKDGMPVMGGLGAIYILSVIPPVGVDRTEVNRGAGSALTGSEAAIGALEITTKASSPDPMLYYEANLGSFDGSTQKIFASGTLGKWGGELTFTHSQSDGIDANGDKVFDLGAFRRFTYDASVTFDITKNMDVRFTALYYNEEQRENKGGYSGASFPIDLGHFHKEDVDIRRSEFLLGWDYTTSNLMRFSFRTLYSNRNQNTTDDDAYTQQPYMEVDETTRLAELRFDTPLFTKHLLMAGLTYRNFDVDGISYKLDPPFFLPQEAHDFIHQRGAFAQMTLSLPARMELTAGTRYDDYELYGSRFSPRMKLTWKATSKFSVAFSAGGAFLAPRPIFERVCCGARIQSSYYTKPEISRNMLLDLNYLPMPWINLRGTFFRNDFKDYLQRLAVFANSNYIPNYALVNFPDVYIQGGEIGMDIRPMERFTISASYTKLKATSGRDTQTYFTMEIPGQEEPFRFPLTLLPAGKMPLQAENSGSATIKWDDSQRNFQVMAQAQYTGSLLIQELPAFGVVKDFKETPDFWVYNFRVQHRIYKHLSGYAGVDNITDEYQNWLDDPRYEFNWGPLRGRYIYAGILLDL
ncbi:MAG: TonB-dependent receptor [Acidobacteriota bacterium]